MTFPLNEKGGWIVPPRTVIAEESEVPDYSEFGKFCTFGSGCEFGCCCKFAFGCKFGNHCVFRYGCAFGSGTFGYSCHFGRECTFASCCDFSSSCVFETDCTFDRCCTFAKYCKLARGCTLDKGCEFGACINLVGCTVLDLVVKRFMTLANVDGSGCQVLIVLGECGNIKVETGCFQGTVKELCSRAKSEGKLVYVAVITAAAKAMKTYENQQPTG